MHDSDRAAREHGLRTAVLAGDERAWRIWYEASFDTLYAFVAWRCAGLRDLTDEVVQETWLIAVRRVRRFNPDRSSFLSWLRGIAVNVLRNHLRRQRRHGTVAPLPKSDDLCTAPSVVGGEGRERAERIAEALARLSNRQEAVLRAKYLDQQTVEQIAASWSETPKAIESLLSRARLAFRQAYLRLE
jgi:RNA polymerase sigma-70 factor (ECF subfamily)